MGDGGEVGEGRIHINDIIQTDFSGNIWGAMEWSCFIKII